MQRIAAFFSDSFEREKDNLWLWMPVLFGFGIGFYFTFEEGFLANFAVFAVLFFAAFVLYFFYRNSLQSLIFLSCSLFLLGGFYADFYQKNFLNHEKITGKIFVDGVGKVESIRKFYNPVNGVEGANLVISKPILFKAKFAAEKKKLKKKSKKKKKLAKKKPRKKKVVEGGPGEAGLTVADGGEEMVGEKKSKKKRVKKADGESKKKKAKKKKRKKISEKTIKKNFVNLKDYQEIDREFLDHSKNYQQVAWQQIEGREAFPDPPPKISINLVKNFQNIAVNDVIALRLMLQPAGAKEFPDDFDFVFDAKAKKIGAYGFALGEAKILRKAEISSLDQWFLALREKARVKILSTLEGDIGAIASAFLIGDQSQISKKLTAEIRNSGLAHLLSISGFHLALAGAIFFVGARFALSRSEYLALHFDLKKIAAIAAIFSTFFYLKIAASPLPAQRAFLMIFLVLVALFANQKINSKRAIMISVLILILLNPYSVFNVSFQLSFAAILVLTSFHELLARPQGLSLWRRFFWYFAEIILASILIQIAVTPFLMRSFQNVSLLGFLANILAIPLSSFVIMPLGFLALFLMPLNLESGVLFLMGKGIFLIEKIAIFVANLSHSNFVSPQLSSLGLAIAIFGLLLICLSKSHLRLLGILVFCSSFLTLFFDKKPDLLFDGKQKFFALYDEKNGLVFSKNLRPSKKRELWMKRMGENEFKSLSAEKNSEVLCDEEKCVIDLKTQKILVLLLRNKISEICKNDFDVIVNLTAKYQLPRCISEEKIKIDNSDFHKKGGHFFYFEEGKILIKTTF